MNIKYQDWGKTQFDTVENYAGGKLDGNSYEGGALEEAAETAERVKKSFGRLIDTLAEKLLLTAEEIVEIVEEVNCYDEVSLWYDDQNEVSEDDFFTRG